MTWAVLQTFPGAADGGYRCDVPVGRLPLALKHLAWQGFQYYNPRIRHRLGSTWRICQLFRDYVFVQPGERWRALNSTRGVLGLLMSSDEKPAVIKDEIVEALIQRERNGIVDLASSRFRMGQRVQVVTGLAAWELGIYDGQKDHERAYVLMGWLGSSRRVEIKEDNLVAVAA